MIIQSPRSVQRYAETLLPTRWGTFQVIVYRADEEKEHLAIVTGDPAGDEVPTRIHSECWTSEALGSLKCDCREQLEAALTLIARANRGVVVYLRQEGRGIGLGNKIRAYALQELGLDTVEANERLGFAVDLRDYWIAAAILADLGVRSVSLMTNNQDKLIGLQRAGIRIASRSPHWVARHEHNQGYLAVKRTKLGHLPDTDESVR